MTADMLFFLIIFSAFRNARIFHPRFESGMIADEYFLNPAFNRSGLRIPDKYKIRAGSNEPLLIILEQSTLSNSE